MGVVGDTNWRKNEQEEFREVAKGSRSAYASFIRGVIAEKGSGGNWAADSRNDDTRKAIAAAREEMAANNIRGDVADYMAKQVENENRVSRGMAVLPDAQGQMNRSSGAWAPAATAPSAPAMEAPSGPVQGRTFYRDATPAAPSAGP